ncbi:MAG: type II toxin-antitoxin system HicB family antitoxin [Spirulinaceae cyanobacterium]
MKINAMIHPAAEGGYWAEVSALPGCITEGETLLLQEAFSDHHENCQVNKTDFIHL